MANKKALIVGINYQGTSSELRGCINDAHYIDTLLRTTYDFTNIKKLIEEEATTANILAGLEWLVDGAQPGDILFFHYSGHGSQLFDVSGEEGDKFDEIICPIDLDWINKVIRDDDMKRIFDKVPTGANLTVLLDCCNSGSGLDQTESLQVYGLGEARSETARGINRYMPPPSEMMELIQQAHAQRKERAVQSRNVNTSALLISGSQAQQTSADAYIDGIWQGAATYAFRNALSENSSMSYRTLVTKMNDFMVRESYSQRPELNGNKLLYDQPMLSSFAQLGVPAAPVAAPSAPEEQDNSKLWLALLGIALLLFVVFG